MGDPTSDIPEDCDPRIRRIHAYWDEQRQGRAMPSRADIDPIDLPDLLGGIILVDVTEEPFDCRYRLVGTDIVEKIGHDPTGQSVAEGFLGPSADFVLDNYRAVVTGRAVRFVDEPFEERRGWPVDAQRIFLPLSEDGERVNMVLVYATV